MSLVRPLRAPAAVAGLLALGGSLAFLVPRLAPNQSPDQSPDLVYGAGPEGVSVFDVADVANPIRVGVERIAAPALDVAPHWGTGTAAYAAVGEQWAIIDAGDPASPQVSDWRPVAPRYVSLVHAADQRLFVVAADPSGGAATVLIHDATSPLKPALIGRLDLNTPVRGLDASAGHLFVATGAILVIYDIRAPTSPSLVGRVPRSAVAVAVDGPTAYVLEAGGLAIVDVSDPDSPKELGYAPLPVASARDVDLLRDAGCQMGCLRAVVGADVDPNGGGGGLFVVDGQSPAQPQVLGPAAPGLPVVDVSSDGPWIHTASGASGYGLFRYDPGGLPRIAGRASVPLDAVAPRTPWQAQPTATATSEATTETPTGTSTASRPTFTPTPTARGATATETPSGRTATPTATLDRPGPTSVWERHDGESDAVPFDRVHYVAEAPGGRVWIRLARPDGGPDRALESRGDRVVLHETLEAAVESRYRQIILDGSVEQMWAVDPLDRVWVGPQFYDGRSWRRLAIDEQQPGGSLVHEERALLASDGRAWVPYRAVVSCPSPEGCRTAGLRIFGEEALERALPLDLVPEAAEFGIEAANLIEGRAGTIAVAEAAPQQGDEDWVVGHRSLTLAPDGEAVAYPELGEGDQNAGYATGSARMPDGRLQVFTWVEDHSRPGLAWRTLANTWQGPGWQVWDLTPECPLVHDGNEEYLRVTAAAYGPDGTLWLGSSYGELATWRDGAWLTHFTSDNSPLLDERPVTDITVTSTGSAWVVQPGALLTYGSPGELTVAFAALAPAVHQR